MKTHEFVADIEIPVCEALSVADDGLATVTPVYRNGRGELCACTFDDFLPLVFEDCGDVIMGWGDLDGRAARGTHPSLFGHILIPVSHLNRLTQRHE